MSRQVYVPEAPVSGPGPTYLVVEEVAKLLRCSIWTVYRIARSDPTFPMLKVGGLVRFPRSRLEQWLRDREQGRPRMRLSRKEEARQ